MKYNIIGTSKTPIQWLLLTPYSTGNSPINDAMAKTSKPIKPVNKKTKIETKTIVKITTFA